MLVAGVCLAVKAGLDSEKENEMIRPNVTSPYCVDKLSCSGNHTKSCHCDSLCEIMSDCCKGYKPNKPLRKIPTKVQYSCYEIDDIQSDSTFGALVVSKCPDDWSDTESRNLCELGSGIVKFSNTYISYDGVVFNNVFCGLCNIALPNEYNMHMLKLCTNESLVEQMEDKAKCNFLYERRAENASIRHCPRRAIKECTLEMTDNLSKNCTAGEYGLVYDSYGNIYRNIYCALCNGIPEEDISCEKDEVYVGAYALTKLIQNEESYEYKSNSDVRGKTNGAKLTDSNREEGQMYLTVVALVISILALAITLVVYSCFPNLLNIPGKITFCLALSLLVAQILFLVSSETERIPWLCVTIAVCVHYFFLAAFCWMNIIAFDLWMTFANHKFDCGDKKKFFYYNLYAWIIPVVIVAIAVAFNFSESVGSLNPRYGVNGCWLYSENAKLLLFIGPLALFKLFDIVAFSCTVYYIRKARRDAAFARKGDKCAFLINIKLSLIMGLTWTFAFLAKYSDNDVLLYLFTFFNAFQGFFIFLCFVCTKKVFKLVRKSCQRKDKSTTSKSSSNVNSSHGTRSTSI